MTSGGRNLTILGIGAILIAMVTSGIALTVYHHTGDIYLDRSRPGFLPDKTEVKEETSLYKFNSDVLTPEVLEKFDTEFQSLLTDLDAAPAPMSEKSISNESIFDSNLSHTPSAPL